jgi:insertion element IS1 protein InsB
VQSSCRAQQDQHHGHLHTGKQHHQCQKCGRQCIVDATDRVMAGEPRTLGERLRRVTITGHGIRGAGGGSIRWLRHFLVTCFAAFSDHRHGQPVASPRDGILGRLEVAGDELGSYVKQKANKQVVWMVMDQQTRQSLALHVGDRRHDSAKQVWTDLPAAYREQATLYTDQYAVDLGVMPAAQHQAITQRARTTNHSARFNNTVRQRVSRLVRDSLACSKKLAIIAALSHTAYAMTT